MDFNQLFLASLLSEKNFTKSILIEKYLPKNLPVPKVKDNPFFYIQAYGDINAKYPYFYEMQGLNSYCILLTLEGKAILNYFSKEFILNENTLVFIDCNIHHSLKIYSSSWHFIEIFVNGATISQYFKLFSDNNLISINIKNNNNIFKLFDKIKNHYECNTTQEFAINSKIIMDLLTEIILQKETSNNCNIPSYILEIKNKFEKDYQNQYTLDILSKEYHINKFKIAREFTKYINMPPINYLIKCRIDKAKELLWNTNESISEIGRLVGIENTTHFINLFKRQTNVTPLAYRNKRNENQVFYTEISKP